jgi:hypothetical protein
MVRKDKLIVIYNALKLLAPLKEYDLTDYDIFFYDDSSQGYVQVFCLDKSIFVESAMEIPTEISTLFKLRKVSDNDSAKIYDAIEKDTAALDIIRPPSVDAVLYRAIPRYDLFNEIK